MAGQSSTAASRYTSFAIHKVYRMQRRRRPGRSQNEVQVAEFVPKVASIQSGAVGSAQVRPAGDGLEHLQMASPWLVKAGQQTVDDPYASLRCDHEIGPTPHRDDVPVGVD